MNRTLLLPRRVLEPSVRQITVTLLTESCPGFRASSTPLSTPNPLWLMAVLACFALDDH